MSTSLAQEIVNYGLHIRPTNFRTVIRLAPYELQNELQTQSYLAELPPGVDYYLPWSVERMKIEQGDAPKTTVLYEENWFPSYENSESFNWLAVAESAFDFWNNEIDDVWNNY
ncbi:MAG: hypothetical protein NT009_08695 [Proteobacteria bacterium]|nr:hypothetical protein [Pseudomonadota bacterium]